MRRKDWIRSKSLKSAGTTGLYVMKWVSMKDRVLIIFRNYWLKWKARIDNDPG
jgi:hypothetical protein